MPILRGLVGHWGPVEPRFGVEQKPAYILETLNVLFSMCQAPHWVPALPPSFLPADPGLVAPTLSFPRPGLAAGVLGQLPLPRAPLTFWMMVLVTASREPVCHRVKAKGWRGLSLVGACPLSEEFQHKTREALALCF